MYVVPNRRPNAIALTSTALKDFVKAGARLLRHGLDSLTLVDIAWLYNHDAGQDARLINGPSSLT